MIEIPELSLAEYVSYERGNGERILLHDGIYWRMAAPFFWKPLFPYCNIPDNYKLPAFFKIGGYQRPSNVELRSNSSINYYVFEEPWSYNLESLDHYSRRDITRSEKHHRLAIISDLQTFCNESYPVYKSFYERTCYQYKNERKRYIIFQDWAKNLFRHPNILVLGAYIEEELAGVMTMCNTSGVIILISLFSSSKFMKKGTSEYLYSRARAMAARTSGASFVFVGMESDREGVNKYKENRGAKLRKNPTRIWINPLANLAMRAFSPGRYQKLQRALSG